MTFDELWMKVASLPQTAKDEVPNALSKGTKRKLSRLSVDEVEKIINSAIEEVNDGSIESLDNLIKKRL